MILLLFPDFSERFAVLEFEIVVFGYAKWSHHRHTLATWLIRGEERKRGEGMLTLGKLPMARRILGLLRRLPP